MKLAFYNKSVAYTVRAWAILEILLCLGLLLHFKNRYCYHSDNFLHELCIEPCKGFIMIALIGRIITAISLLLSSLSVI